MKKKEKIRILEAENKALNEKCEIAFELINAIKRSLKYFGVDMNIVFDFTEHDMKVLEKRP